MNIHALYDQQTFTLTYVVYDESTKDAIVIDPVLDYQPVGSKLENRSFSKVVDFLKQNNLNLHLVLETHAHADHLSSSQLFKEIYPDVNIAISEHIREVQKTFKVIYNLSNHQTDGSQFDLLIKDNQILTAGSLTIKALPTPGHTPACLSYLIDDAVFTGDALFMPDYGTGRCDFPKGDANALYHSVTEVLYQLDDNTRIFVGHDYLPNGRELKYTTSIKDSKASNKQLTDQTTKEEFVTMRETRDSSLSAPVLLFPSIQVNIEAGHLPKQEDNNKHYLKIPLNLTFQFAG
ncbi:MBL fold metallo-hydrolase [Marinicellulosiphila megalodicopiae]|uniref:MBL fold metallo-hydrolase n=1 Tax=Marinicellulosiphila megalodicopiae TaxID=2724896 RepID=UPI003BB002A5